MKRNLLVCTLAIGAVALLTGAAVPGPSFQFTSIDYPEAVATQADGINPGGEIVSPYTDSAGKEHGFLLSGGNFTSIDYPGAIYTDARGISPGGDIVGSFQTAPGGPANWHGYLLSQGKFTEILVPGYLGSFASGSLQPVRFTVAATIMTSWPICADLSAMSMARTQYWMSALP